MCDAVFDQQDAEVVCRELDCGAPVQVLDQLLLAKETLRCGHKRFSAEEMNLRFISVQHHHHMKNSCSHDNVYWTGVCR